MADNRSTASADNAGVCCGKEQVMSDIETCFGCGAPIRRGYPMVTQSGKDVIVCERCKRVWEKRKLKEAEITKGADDEVLRQL